ncbi:MAG TPA: purine-nucleoside phosphorylase [Bryobacteraceae bacterium]|jgi:purine-nucleoside phosphorylase|nr:purine-nucleoside phosphorylase [Bryobacteraceae bacterium]
MSNASDYIESVTTVRPRVAVILGSGLGAFADSLDNASVVDYHDIPDWPRSTAVGHAGKLVTGTIEGVPVAALAGRVHLYEGYTARQVVFGVRTLSMMGVDSLVLTNAAGGINADYKPGDLVLISDHINLTGQNPLTGPNDESLGPRFPDMSEAYLKSYREIAVNAGAEMGLELKQGVYAAVPGPSYETPAEIRYLRAIGADLVGMSTVPETIAANHESMKVLGISCVTNFAAGVTDQKLDHKEVLQVGAQIKDTLVELLRRVLPRLSL